MMIKIKRKIAFVALWLLITFAPPLQATQSNTAKPDADAPRNYANHYLVKALDLPDISAIVIGYISHEDEYFISLLDLMIRLKYQARAAQMISKAGQETLLLRSVQEGHLACVKYLHKQGADIDAKDNDGRTALIWGAYSGYLDCVKYLQAQGADVNAKNRWKETALIKSAEEGYLDCVRYLCEQGADINAKNRWEETPLMLSAYEGHLDCLKYLCQQGADIHAKNKNGDTALRRSASRGHVACTHYLRQQGVKEAHYTKSFLGIFNCL